MPCFTYQIGMIFFFYANTVFIAVKGVVKPAYSVRQEYKLVQPFWKASGAMYQKELYKH